jgi:uncharacterized membrane protein
MLKMKILGYSIIFYKKILIFKTFSVIQIKLSKNSYTLPRSRDYGINYIIITACSYACETCTANTVSSCTACYGSSGQSSSRILPACTCPLLGFWDNYPYQSECQACVNTRCLSCTNSTSICTACVGTVSNSFAGSRTLPTCGCPNGYYDNAMYADCQTCAA